MSAISSMLNLKRATGLLGFLRIAALRVLRSNRPLQLNGFSIYPSGSDPFVFGQVFGSREYDVGPQRRNALRALMAKQKACGAQPVIIDGGGNVGFAAAFLSMEYPNAIIISVEPDPHSFEQLKANCKRYPNIVPVYGAIWVHGAGVNLGNTDKPSWARTVEGRGSTPSFTLDQLLARVDRAAPSILKLDIEGAEAEVLKHSASTVRKFPCVLIEPHDFLYPGRGTLVGLFSALAGRQIDTLVNGENLMLFDLAALDYQSAATKRHHRSSARSRRAISVMTPETKM